MKIVLVPGEGENIEEILSVKPTLSVSGFYTKTIYDFQKKTFSAYSEEKDITPAGEWEIKDGRLVGKRAYFDSPRGDCWVSIHNIGSCRQTIYQFYYHPLYNWKVENRELEITFVSAKDILMSKVNGEIGDWGWDRSGSYRIGYFA